MKFTIHPLFFAVMIFSALFGGFLVCIIFALTALLHECGHVFCAARLGYECRQIKLMPYGAAAVCDIDGINARDEALLALAGPAVNAAICVALAGLWWFFPDTYAFTDTVMAASAVMLAVNLLPAYPLDGGRLAKCALSRLFSRRAAEIVPRAAGLAVAAGFVVAFFLCGCNVTFAAFALFLAFSAFEKSPPAARINFASRAALKRGLEVKTVLVGGDLTVRGAVRLLDDKRYLVLRNADDGRELTQDELFSVMAGGGLYDEVFALAGNAAPPATSGEEGARKEV